MAGGSSDGNSRELDKTPTWAVAVIVAIIIIISIVMEKVLHSVGEWFTKRRKKALVEALEKVKAELMILGFISLLLTFGQNYIAKICIPLKVADTMLPCSSEMEESHRRRLLFYDFSTERRILAAGAAVKCGTGKVSFFRQFFRSVRKADYLAMRHGFIVVHLAPGTKFDFQKYIKRTLEDDFKVVVGISPILWASAVIFLLINVHGWQALFYVSILPLVIVLAVGAKLQAIITKMAIEIQERHAVVQGIPLVHVGDKYFWFGRPTLVLFLLHFALFQNSFQIIYFLWIWYEFGLKSCLHQNFRLVIARVALGAVVQFICSYVTLPLYALVSQMGSHMKKSIFDEHTSRALKKWHQNVKKKLGKSGHSTTKTLGSSQATPSASPSASPVHPFLHRFKTTGHSSSGSRRIYYSDQDASDVEGDMTTALTAVLIENTENSSHEVDHELAKEEHVRVHVDEDDFSFAKPAPSDGKNT